LRVVDILEHNGEGLNLTHEVRDGILKHSKGYGKIGFHHRRQDHTYCGYHGLFKSRPG
jgi:hypothetical protein